jgi:hypothetical protein
VNLYNYEEVYLLGCICPQLRGHRLRCCGSGPPDPSQSQTHERDLNRLQSRIRLQGRWLPARRPTGPQNLKAPVFTPLDGPGLPAHRRLLLRDLLHDQPARLLMHVPPHLTVQNDRQHLQYRLHPARPPQARLAMGQGLPLLLWDWGFHDAAALKGVWS